MLRKLAKASVALMLLYIGVILFNSYGAYDLRSNTSKILFSGYFDDSRLPHILIPRIILYRAGSRSYNLDILKITKRKESDIDCFFIKRLERKIDPKAIINNLHELVKHDFGQCIAKAIALDTRIKMIDIDKHQDDIFPSEKSINISSFISSFENKLTDDQLVKFLEINNSDRYYYWLSDMASMGSATSTTIDYHALFNKVEFSMDKREKTTFLTEFSTKSNSKNISQLVKLFEENKEFLDKNSKDQIILAIFYKSLVKQDWVIDYFKKSENINQDLSVSSVYSNSRGGKLPWVSNDLSYLHETAKLSVKINNDLASHFYHTLIHEIENHDSGHEENIELPKELKIIKTNIESLLTASNDSGLKKNLIVLATRHPYSTINYETVDNAFSQGEARTFLFTDESQYIENSSATKDYETISENLYISDSDKYRVWPIRPYSNSSQENVLAKIPMWEEFIEKYPFHPGVDDAYLRIAFDLYNTEQFYRAFEKLSEYFSKNITHDISAEDRIKGLLAHTLKEIKYKDIPDKYKAVKYMYEMAFCIVDDNCKEHDNLDLIHIDKENLKRVTFLNQGQIKNLLELAKLDKKQIIDNILKSQSAKNAVISLSFITSNKTLNECMIFETCGFLLDKKQCFSDDSLCSFSHKPVY